MKNILSDKYKTYDLLAKNMFFIGIYCVLSALIINKLVLFFTEKATAIPVNFSIFFFFIIVIVHIPFFSLNQQINCKKAVVQNIKTVNVLYLFIIFTRIVFCIILIPSQFLTILILLKDILNEYFLVSTIVCCLFSVISISAGLYFYVKKRHYIREIKNELSELKI